MSGHVLSAECFVATSPYCYIFSCKLVFFTSNRNVFASVTVPVSVSAFVCVSVSESMSVAVVVFVS